MYYVVKYSGTFGFIKPWTAVRDSKTFSQQFLTPASLEGIQQDILRIIESEECPAVTKSKICLSCSYY
jgi:hypothetical protein